MTTERIDVLAVMQKAEYDYLEDGFREAADAMGLARAAVAELIEACGEQLTPRDGAIPNLAQDIRTARIRAALARVGGA